MATNFPTSIIPLHFISRLCALANFNYELGTISKVWIFYSFVFVTFMSFMSIFQLESEITDESNSKLFKFVSFIRIASPTITRATICIVFITKYKIILHFINCISDVEYVIHKALDVPLTKGLYLRFQKLVIIFILIAVLIHGFLTFNTSGLLSAILSTFMVMSYLAQAQFISCVLLLNQYIQTINTKLDQLSRMNKCFKSSHHIFEICCISYIQNDVSEEDKHEQLACISKELIRYISIIKEDLNSYFSFPILLIIADILLITTFNLYMLIKSMTTSSSQDIFNKLSYLYTVTLNVIQVGFIAFSCAGANKTIQSVSTSTHKLLNRKKVCNKSDTLILLSKQLMHVEIVFTACGFFTLDDSLITSVFAAISTQLVILLQFQMSSNSQHQQGE